MIKIAPSVLACDFNNLKKEITLINRTKCQYIHCDIMDGNFVPNISFGSDIVKSINKYSKKKLDVHLMIKNVDKYVNDFAKAGADIITFHIEAEKNPIKIIKKIKRKGIKCGIAIKPKTRLNSISKILRLVDLVLIMTVEPGFGGQKFLYSQLKKISELKKIIEDKSLDIDIEVDGGINSNTAKKCVKAGANVLVAGSYIFKHPKNKYNERIEKLRK